MFVEGRGDHFKMMVIADVCIDRSSCGQSSNLYKWKSWSHSREISVKAFAKETAGAISCIKELVEPVVTTSTILAIGRWSQQTVEKIGGTGCGDNIHQK